MTGEEIAPPSLIDPVRPQARRLLFITKSRLGARKTDAEYRVMACNGGVALQLKGDHVRGGEGAAPAARMHARAGAMTGATPSAILEISEARGGDHRRVEPLGA